MKDFTWNFSLRSRCKFVDSTPSLHTMSTGSSSSVTYPASPPVSPRALTRWISFL